jgi:SAM-dependent methyltransferase
MPAFDYSVIADLYDSFCRFEDDIEFFRESLKNTQGLVLELMVGTGRVSVPLLEAGVELVCVDASLPMLEVLKGKLRGRDLGAHIVCCEVERLPFECCFQAGIWPFHGISELAARDDRHRALRELCEALVEGALLLVTLHNPTVRHQTIDGQWHDHGTYSHLDGRGAVALSSRLEVDPEDGSIVGVQRVEELSESGERLASREVPLRFALPSRAEMECEFQDLGLDVEELWGDYEGSLFDAGKSPHMIWKLRR